MGVVEEAVADGVGDGGVDAAILEEVAALLVFGRGQAPVVDDEHVAAGEAGEEDRVGAVGVGQRQFLVETGARR